MNFGNVNLCRWLIICRHFYGFISLSIGPQSQEPTNLENIFVLVAVEPFPQAEGTFYI